MFRAFAFRAFDYSKIPIADKYSREPPCLDCALVILTNAAEQAIEENGENNGSKNHVDAIPLEPEGDQREHHADDRRGNQQQETQLNDCLGIEMGNAS